MPETLIIGGGISGLSAAYYLAKGGARSVLVESRPRLGGVIQTEHVEGCVIEAGPDSFLSVKPAALELIRELGLADQVIGSNDHLRKTFVRRGGRLIALPDGLMMMVPTRILPLLTTGLIGWGTKLRMGLELFRAPKPRAEDESVAEFIEEHYGREAVDYLAEPLLSGVYGGSPQALSVQSVLPRFVELADAIWQPDARRAGGTGQGANREDRCRCRCSARCKAAWGRWWMPSSMRPAARSRSARAGRKRWNAPAPASASELDGDWLEADHLVLACGSPQRRGAHGAGWTGGWRSCWARCRTAHP